jgi:hypothetical protein
MSRLYIVSPAVLKKGGLGLFRGRSPSISGDTGAAGAEKRQSIAPHGRVTEEKHHHVPLKTRLTVAKVLGAGSSAPGSPSAGSHAGTEASAAEEKGLYYCCCGKDEEEDRMAEFKNIFVGGHPLWYFRYGVLWYCASLLSCVTRDGCFFVVRVDRAVELQIMFTCMYMALWATNFITIVKDTESLTTGEQGLCQFLM